MESAEIEDEPQPTAEQVAFAASGVYFFLLERGRSLEQARMVADHVRRYRTVGFCDAFDPRDPLFVELEAMIPGIPDLWALSRDGLVNPAGG